MSHIVSIQTTYGFNFYFHFSAQIIYTFSVLKSPFLHNLSPMFSQTSPFSLHSPCQFGPNFCCALKQNSWLGNYYQRTTSSPLTSSNTSSLLQSFAKRICFVERQLFAARLINWGASLWPNARKTTRFFR